jgi:tight adherence protein B
VTGQAEQLAGALAGFAIILATIGLALRAERAHLNARLRTFLGGQTPSGRTQVVVLRSPSATARRRVLGRGWLGAQPRQLAQAGLVMSPGRFLALQLGAGLLGLGLGRLVSLRFGLEGTWPIVALVIGTMVGLWVPKFVLQIQRDRRIRKAELQFPLAVDTIASAIQAGQSLPQAIELLGRDMPPPVGIEFAQVVRELGIGVPFEQALNGLAERLGMRDAEIFVAAVHIQYRTGGNLSDTLRGIANTIRERLRIRGEIRVLTSQQRIAAYIVSAMPLCIAVMLKFASPSYFDRLLEPGMMRILVVSGILGLVAGYYFLRRIADIEL